ncbi:MAG: undecaprenyl-diphosphatase [Gammaproteobacteria bacterium]|nr:MAG: undecaprenyl-diphosphatase [Gammaproteobacteria bacterium]
MEMVQILVLAAVQGLTEFLPISSSAHLVLVPMIFGWPDQGLAFDVAVHVGTLGAVVTYFHRDLGKMTVDWVASLRAGQTVGDSRLAWGVMLATVPVALGGLALRWHDENLFRSPLVVAGATVLFALLLWWADRSGARARDEHHLNWRDILVIGVAQVAALIPGTSRSGITMTAGLAMGLTRAAAARFSFLMAIPVIGLAGGVKAVDAWHQQADTDWMALLLGIMVAWLTASLCIHWFLKLLDRIGFLPFVIYRLVLGAGLFIHFA